MKNRNTAHEDEPASANRILYRRSDLEGLGLEKELDDGTRQVVLQ